MLTEMDSSKRQAVTPSKSRLAQTFAKVLQIRAATGIAPVDGFQKPKYEEKIRVVKTGHKIKVDTGSYGGDGRHKSHDLESNELKNKVAAEALLARIFASISSIKAAYAQLQLAQSPYNAEAIQASDHEVVSQLKALSELKYSYAKKQFDAFPEETLISAEIQERKSVLKTYGVMKRKLGSQVHLKDSEITFLQEKLEESKKDYRLLERRSNASGQLSGPDNLHLSGLTPNHFILVLRHTVRSIRCFVKFMIGAMQSSGWDLDAAASAIQPGVAYWKEDHKCFAFESFVCQEMFNGFHHPNFSLPNVSLPEPEHRRRLFFERFIELKSVKAKDFLEQKPKSTFGKFCRAKYLRLVHPRMESSFFGNLNLRNMVNSGQFPETPFFVSYAEMAKRVWLLHCLAFSFDSPAMIFQMKRNCRFSEVFMESVADEAFTHIDDGLEETLVNEPSKTFTVVPGFKIGKTVIQTQVYLSIS